MAQHWGRRGANVSENEGVRSKCKKFGENSRQMAPVSTICDEYCSASTLTEVQVQIQRDLPNTATWTKDHGMAAHPEKTKYMIINIGTQQKVVPL